MQLAEPLVFYTNYQRSQSQFYYGERPFDYGPGFGITVGAGLALLISGGLGVVTFCGMTRRIIKTAFNPEQQVRGIARRWLILFVGRFFQQSSVGC